MKRIRWIVLMSMILLLSGCNGGVVSQLTPVEEVEKKLQEMVSYEAQAQITFTKNKKSSTMKVEQVYNMDGTYELTILEPEHVKGYKTTYDGQKITEYNPETGESVQVEASPVKNEVLFGVFTHNYLESGTKKNVQEQDTGMVVLETVIPGNYKYMAYERAWFDEKTQIPKKIEIYGQDETLTICIEIITFQYNVQK